MKSLVFPYTPGSWLIGEVRDFLSAARRGSRPLYHTALAHGLLLLIFLVASWMDHRTVQDVNAWHKPMKFAFAIACFTLTYAYFLHFLRPSPWRSAVGYGISACMSTEIILIGFQAGRGVASHFNNTTAFDLAIFSVMGGAVVLNTLLTLGVFIRFCFPMPSIPPALRMAIRLGMLVFLFGNLVGGYMVKVYSHSGPAGDLRLAHFLGMHAIQVVPGFAWVMARYGQNAEFRVLLVGLAYAGLVGATFLKAIYG